VANSACSRDVLFTNARVLIFHDFALSKERLSFLSGFVTVGEDSVLENRATWDKVAACHRSMTIPDTPRFSRVPDDTSFKVPVTLTGIGPLSDALVRRLI
jgi:hypothetical protein